MKRNGVQSCIDYIIGQEAQARTVAHIETLDPCSPESRDEAYARAYYIDMRLTLVCELSRLWYVYENGTRDTKVVRRIRHDGVYTFTDDDTGSEVAVKEFGFIEYEGKHDAREGETKHLAMLGGMNFKQLCNNPEARFLAFLEVREARRHGYQNGISTVISFIHETDKKSHARKLGRRRNRVERAQLEYNSRDEIRSLSDNVYDGADTEWNESVTASLSYGARDFTRFNSGRVGVNEFQPVTIVREVYTEHESEMWANAQFND